MNVRLATAALVAVLALQTRADEAAAPAAPAAAVSPTAPVFGFEVRLGGERVEGGVLGIALLARTGFLRLSLAAEALQFTPGETFYPPLEPGDPSRVGRGAASYSAAFGWTGGVPGARADLLGEVGGTRVSVFETFPPDAPRGEISQTHWFPFVGARAGASLRMKLGATSGQLFLGAAVFGRYALTGTRCLATSYGCEDAGGWTAGLVVFAGTEGRLR